MAHLGAAASSLSRLGLHAVAPPSFSLRRSALTLAGPGCGAMMILMPWQARRRALPSLFSYRQYAALASPALPLRPRIAAAVALPRAARHYTPISSSIALAQLTGTERVANGNPGNPVLQNKFYQLLLRNNRCAILVERYQSGRFATNAAADEAYRKALAILNAGAHATSTAASVPAAAHHSASPAVGANSAAANLAAANATVNAAGYATAGPVDPIPVLIRETPIGIAFNYIKFIAYFGLSLWMCFAIITLLLEVSTVISVRSDTHTNAQVEAQHQTTRLSDVHGCDEAKEELKEVIDFLKNPDSFTHLGAKLPKGVLLAGPPGTGKTLLARAVAGEAGVPFFYMSGSEFEEMYVGVGARRVRDLFNTAKSKSPAIVFIDELDAIGGRRTARDSNYSRQTLNQLLTELDGFTQDSKIVIMGATNLPDLLDKALVRPGRFDRHISIDLPDVRGRLAILRHHSKGLKLAQDIDLVSVASRSAGRSGAELENILNFAAIHASRAKAKMISKADVDWAVDRVVMGADKTSMLINEKEKEMTAYHEAGHALVQLFEKDVDTKLYKVTIMPKGRTLGHTAFLPAMDKYSRTAAEYLSSIRVSLGGKMAEEMQYGTDKDLQRATEIGFAMVTKFGMSHAVGPVGYDDDRYADLSSETKATIEVEVQKLLKESYEDVRRLLTEKRRELDLLARALVQYETLSKQEVELVIRGEPLPGKPMLVSRPMVLPPSSTQAQAQAQAQAGLNGGGGGAAA